MVLLIITGIWAAVLVPPALRARVESTPSASVGAFQRQLSALGGSNVVDFGRPHIVPAPVEPRMTLRQARQRRREVLSGLGAASLVSFLAAVTLGGPVLWSFHLLCLTATGGYVWALVTIRQRSEARVRPAAPVAVADDGRYIDLTVADYALAATGTDA